MATKKLAESTLYHVSPSGFWKKLRDTVVINPEISTGLPIVEFNRYPQPASRPEKYSTPATKASDPAQNPYWKRDVRRAYPQLSVVTQSELSALLIEHASPAAVSAPGSTEVAAKETPAVLDLVEAITKVGTQAKVYTESKLPPALPSAFKPWKAQLSPPPPQDPHAYFPMDLYK